MDETCWISRLTDFWVWPQDLRSVPGVLNPYRSQEQEMDPYRWLYSIPMKATKQLFTHLIANFSSTPTCLVLGFALPGREEKPLVLPDGNLGF